MSQNQKNNSLQDILQNIDSMSQNKERVSVDDIVGVHWSLFSGAWGE
jgi:hypothetical protein